MNELEVNGEVPVYPPTITGAQVLHSPFDDIVPRNIVHPHLVKGATLRACMSGKDDPLHGNDARGCGHGDYRASAACAIANVMLPEASSSRTADGSAARAAAATVAAQCGGVTSLKR